MLKSKFVVIAMAGMLAMCVGLTACGGGNNASSSAASSSTASSSSAASSSTASSSSASNQIVYWEGTLPDGKTVSYLDDASSGVAALSIANSDFSDAAVWLGASIADANGKVTITDTESKKTVSYAIVDTTPSSYKVDIEGYGEVELKPVTEADLEAYAKELSAVATVEGAKLLNELEKAEKGLEKEIARDAVKLSKEADKLANEIANLDEKTVFFWDGTLADGSSVSYMDDSQNGQAYLSVVKADLSDGAVWYGKCSTSADGKTTLTDEETGKTVTYAVAETTPGTSMNINIDGYGDAKLNSVTKGDFAKLLEELAKLSNTSTTK